MKRYLKIFIIGNKAIFMRDLALGPKYLVNIIGSTSYFIFHMLSFYFIIQKFSFPGWSTNDLWTLIFTFEIFTYASFYLYWRGLRDTVKGISDGGFDYIMIRPINTRFITMIKSGSAHNLIAIALGITGLLIVGWTKLNVVSIFFYFLSIVCSLYIFHLLSCIMVSFNFFFGKLESAGAIYQFQEVWKYPYSVFENRSIFISTFVYGISLLTSIPTVIFLNKPVSPMVYINYLSVLVIAHILVTNLWNFALRHYSSASS